MINSGGQKFLASEVESVLSRHPAVREVAVVAAPHEIWGECAKGFVVPVDRETISTDELRQFCRSQMPGFKVPQDIEFVSELPRNANGKILKHQLPTDASFRK